MKLQDRRASRFTGFERFMRMSCCRWRLPRLPISLSSTPGSLLRRMTILSGFAAQDGIGETHLAANRWSGADRLQGHCNQLTEHPAIGRLCKKCRCTGCQATRCNIWCRHAIARPAGLPTLFRNRIRRSCGRGKDHRPCAIGSRATCPYVSGSSDADTTAADTFHDSRGRFCRDYAI